MDRRKLAEDRARAGRNMLKSMVPSTPATRTRQRLARLYEERDYLEIRLSRLSEAVPCDLISLARVLRELAVVEEEIIGQKNRALSVH